MSYRTEDEIKAFETQHHVVLPTEYRQFMMQIENGGAGPYYGILRLDEWAELPSNLDDGTVDNTYLSATPLVAPDLHMQKERWNLIRREHKIHEFRGCLTLGLQGCTYFTVLIVTGEHSGRVVYVDMDAQPLYFPKFSGMLDWYEAWLDELLAGHKLLWFGMNKS